MNGSLQITFTAFIILSLFCISCDSKPDRLSEPKDVEEAGEEASAPAIEIAQELSDVRFSQSEGGKLQWKLEAKTVEQIAEGPISLERVEITYYSDDGRVTALTADKGQYDSSARNATLKGNVVVTTSDGGRVETEAIHWDQDRQALKGESQVKISRNNSQINGRGFELLTEDESFTIYQVDGIIHRGDVSL